jgi:hypothetical protein
MFALLLLAGALGACAGQDEGSSFSGSPSPSGAGGVGGTGGAGGVGSVGGTGGAGGTTLPFDLDASGIISPDADAPAIGPAADAGPHVVNGTAVGCTCKLTMDFTTLETGDHQPLTLNGATLSVADAATDAAADVPVAAATNIVLGGMHVIALEESTKSVIVVPPAGYFCVVVEYIPITASVPTIRVGYGGSREYVAGPAGSGAQLILAPTPGYVNTVGLRTLPAIDSVRISPGPAGSVEVPAICFGTDLPTAT